jgi:hypothetical protein
MYWRALKRRVSYGKGWIPNWPLYEPVRLGLVTELHRSHGIRALVGDNKLGYYHIKQPGTTEGPVSGPLKVTVGKLSECSFETDANLEGWHWLGDASAGARIAFQKGAGLLLEAEGLKRRRLTNTDALYEAIRVAVVNKRMKPGRSIVIAVETASSIMYVGTYTGDSSINIKLKAGIAPAGLSLASFALGFSRESHTGDAFATPIAKGGVTAFQAVTVGTKGIFRWREIPIRVAAFEGDATLINLAMAEQDFSEDDYVYRFPSDPAEPASRPTITTDDSGF